MLTGGRVHSIESCIKLWLIEGSDCWLNSHDALWGGRVHSIESSIKETFIMSYVCVSKSLFDVSIVMKFYFIF